MLIELFNGIIIATIIVLTIAGIFSPITDSDMKSLGFTNEDIKEYRKAIKTGNREA